MIELLSCGVKSFEFKLHKTPMAQNYVPHHRNVTPKSEIGYQYQWSHSIYTFEIGSLLQREHNMQVCGIVRSHVVEAMVVKPNNRVGTSQLVETE